MVGYPDCNNIVNNTVNNNQNQGISLTTGDCPSNTINWNTVCFNGLVNTDIHDEEGSGSGDNNTCDTVYNWSDTSAVSGGCRYICTENCTNDIDDDGDGDIDCQDSDCPHSCTECQTPTCNETYDWTCTDICSGTDTSCGCDSCINCDNKDGWNATGPSYDCCNGSQKCTCQDQQYLDYSCSGTSCQYTVTDTRTTEYGCSDCNDGLVCNGQENCVEGTCVDGTPVDCSAYNMVGIATCTNDPDNKDYTWDYRAAFTSVCQEPSGTCTTGDETITHTCSISCGAECEQECPGGKICDTDSCTCYTKRKKRKFDCPECEDIGMVIRPEPIVEEPEGEEEEPEEEEEKEPEEEPKKPELKELAIIVPEDITHGGPFTVTIRDKDGNPVGSADVEYNGVVRQTDANGKVQFTAAKGTKTIKTSKQGYKDGSATATSSEVEEEIEEEEKVVEKEKVEEKGFEWTYVILGIIILVLILLFILMRRRSGE